MGIYVALQLETLKVTTFQQFCRRKDCCCAVHLLTVLSSATPWARSLEIYERCSLLFCYFHPR